MSQLRVRLATEDDLNELIVFVRDHWAADHIFVKAPETLLWQYKRADGALSIVLAEKVDETSNPIIVGILGFIPTGRFDNTLADKTILLAVWKVRDDLSQPGLGLRLLKFIQAQFDPVTIGAVGISDTVKPIYRALGYTSGQLHQSALFNPDFSGRCKIAVGAPVVAFEKSNPPKKVVQLLSFANEHREGFAAIARDHYPQKSARYVDERYVEHPWYDYVVRSVLVDGSFTAVVIWRCVHHENSRILRIVDIIGDTKWLQYGEEALIEELRAANAEYIDIMQYGTSPETLRSGGFVDTSIAPSLVLPNYFSPFMANTIEVHLAYKTTLDLNNQIKLYRADSDQDRPNQLYELTPKKPKML